MAKIETINGPIGWLKDPHNKWAIHFDFKKVSNKTISTNFTIDMWGLVSNDKPMIFKSRRKVTREDSLKTWNQLLASNWVEFHLENNKTA